MRTKYVYGAVASCMLAALAVVTLVLSDARVVGAGSTSIPPTLVSASKAASSTKAFVTAGAGTLVPVGPTPQLPPGVPHQLPTIDPNPTPFPGLSAIKPHLQTTDAFTPAFTAADATAFALAHPPALAGGAAITVVNVTFLTNRDAHTKLNIDNSPDRLLCVVELSGTFTVSAPSYQRTASRANVMYDARTGNYLGITIPF